MKTSLSRVDLDVEEFWDTKDAEFCNRDEQSHLAFECNDADVCAAWSYGKRCIASLDSVVVEDGLMHEELRNLDGLK